MEKMKKIIIIMITLFLFSACGTKTNDSVAVVDSNTNLVSEIVSNRSIVISVKNGNVTVTHNNGEKLEAYEGMNLYDGDEVVVLEGSNLTLDIDSDKHLFADENTHFGLLQLVMRIIQKHLFT